MQSKISVSKTLVNTLYRSRQFCKENGVRTIQHVHVSKHYGIELNPLYEEKKFFICIDKTNWPDRMDAIRRGLLQFTLFYKEIKHNNGNEHNILKSLHDTLDRLDQNL